MADLDFAIENSQIGNYDDDSIKHLEGLEHVRLRPGMYIGKLGDGSHFDDGIYVLLKEVLDNSIDEFRMNAGKQIDIKLENGAITVRDYGRGIPQGKMIDAVSMMNTGGKYDSKVFKKSVGLNGVGTKAVNALSSEFRVQSFREGKVRTAIFSRGVLVSDSGLVDTDEPNGTLVYFRPDDDPKYKLFVGYKYNEEFIETMLRNYAYLNTGLTLYFNGKKIHSKNGLRDLLSERMIEDALYPIIHLKGEDIEIAFTHCQQYGEDYYSFVNGQYTTQGGTHQSAFREALGKTIKEFYNKNMELADIRQGIVAAITINVQEPVFESQTKTKLGSKDMDLEGTISVNKFINDFVKKELDNYLHKNQETVDILLQKIQEAEKERKAIAGVTKAARERAKKVSLCNKKLRDCRIHYNDVKGEGQAQSSIFITEGLSASGSITKCRDVAYQAVFSLRGKTPNSWGSTREIVYKNEEYNLLQAALNIEEGMEGLRYNKVIIATDADDDGMHIRLLLLTFFLQFFPDLVRQGHVYILQTPLFRVRDKKQTFYCYTDEERVNAIKTIGPKAEITRFKGLGEIDPEEFKFFIGDDIRLDQVILRKEDAFTELLEFYRGKNTPQRRDFIIDNLVIEEDVPTE
ncbi:MAG: type IIA DNA topoisomerase subunit B [Paludibacteraceae bacterium]|nr:type IIA DNA topoisomerase subunit B [Paludibacteraceae bacterium]MBO7635675.1 type IIA DNA topoisomerase subunit B [Paludibacteraceae bacterium]MBR5973354.1 type IIA DNA topoisomerase subunit B [Paludibacteraceae bacterium]